MEFLTKPMGRFPLGIWFVLVAVLLVGFCMTLFGQGLSVINWELALSLGFQEDSP